MTPEPAHDRCQIAKTPVRLRQNCVRRQIDAQNPATEWFFEVSDSYIKLYFHNSAIDFL
jgi:hypothetical protein